MAPRSLSSRYLVPNTTTDHDSVEIERDLSIAIKASHVERVPRRKRVALARSFFLSIAIIARMISPLEDQFVIVPQREEK